MTLILILLGQTNTNNKDQIETRKTG